MFACGGKNYEYARFKRNQVFNSERTVELPLIMDEYLKCQGAILEVGNVLKQYYPLDHDVVDKYESGDGVINEDILDYNPGKVYDLVISISTVEHIGFDEPEKNPENALRAIEKLRELGKHVLITIPLGYNLNLDNAIQSMKGITQYAILKRISKDNKWIQVPSLEPEIKYNSPYPFANWLLILEYNK